MGFKRYVVYEGPIDPVDSLVVQEGATFNITSNGFATLGADDLLQTGMRIVAIACSRLEADGLDKVQRSNKFNELANGVEKWAIANGLELEARRA